MSGMAEVIVGHIEESGDRYDLRYSASIRHLADDVTELLTAAGFGPAKEAAAVALEDAADEMREERATWCLDDSGRYWINRTLDELRARAAAVRGEG